MNEHLRAQPGPIGRPRSTQAADGLPRRRWTLDDVLAMQKAGILGYDERFELVGGEIVPMSPKGNRHELVKAALTIHWARALPPDLNMLTETTLYISADEFREPDFMFWPVSIAIADVKPADPLLLVEIADSSLGYDLGVKAKHYAALGIREYWVIDAVRLVTHCHSYPAQAGFGRLVQRAADELMTPSAASALAVRLTDLGLKPA
jgi:Uma2 family endonuclease